MLLAWDSGVNSLNIVINLKSNHVDYLFYSFFFFLTQSRDFKICVI